MLFKKKVALCLRLSENDSIFLKNWCEPATFEDAKQRTEDDFCTKIDGLSIGHDQVKDRIGSFDDKPYKDVEK